VSLLLWSKLEFKVQILLGVMHPLNYFSLRPLSPRSRRLWLHISLSCQLIIRVIQADSVAYDTYYPTWSVCFENTVLTWIVCFLLWICAPFYGLYLWQRVIDDVLKSVVANCRRSPLNIAKLVTTHMLIGLRNVKTMPLLGYSKVIILRTFPVLSMNTLGSLVSELSSDY